MAGATIGSALIKAVEDFKTTGDLTKDELQSFQFSTLEHVQTAIVNLQSKQAQTKRLRYMKRLEPFLETMKDYGKVVDVFVNSSEILAFVWGPMKYILLVASTYAEAFSSILTAYEIIGEQIPLLSGYQSLFEEKPHMRTLLVLIFQDILTFHREALRFFKQRLWRQLFQATWKGFLLKIKELKSNLSRHHNLLESRASLEQFEAIQSVRRSAEAAFKEQHDANLSQQRLAVLQWLSPTRTEVIHERHVQTRGGNSNAGQWLVDDRRFQNWFHPLYCSTPLLWLNGKPGAGKTVLASRVIEEAKAIQDFSLAFFYCAETDPERNSFISVARGILSQLVVQCDHLIPHFREKMLKSGEVSLSSSALAKELLETALSSRKSYVIIDGIDECSRDQRKEICAFFRNLVDSLPRTKMDEIRCLFVSQDDGIARKDLSMLPTIRIGVETNRVDIEAFAKLWQTRIEERFGIFSREDLDIVQVVTARSLGMFIFARCVCEELFQQPSRQALLEEWRSDKFPEDLEALYRRILKRLLESGAHAQRQTTRKLLAWISCSRRPLRWFEIQAAISIDLENQTINDEQKRLVDDSKDLCASLVEVHSDQTVELVHPTLKRFLLDEKVVKCLDVDRELASLSISYLCFPAIDAKTDTPTLESAVKSGQYAFYEYGVTAWVSHLLAWLPEAKENEIETIAEDFETFLDQHYVEPTRRSVVSQKIETMLKSLSPLDIYPSAVQAIVWARKSMLSETKETSASDDVLDFPTLTTSFRAVMERIAESGDSTDTQMMEKFYGTGFYKCPKVYCQHFYKGFSKRDDRDKHVNRHDRAFTCSVEGCPMATFGCVSNADLTKHKLAYHGLRDDEDDFPSPPDPKRQQVTERHTFQCALCPKRFTRAANLRAHLRIHTDERPFVCTVCGKSFARQHDRRRHETLHSGERKFVCRGDLENGAQWGCGTRFSRPDSLGQHFRSEIGRICIKPLLDEELARRQLQFGEYQRGLQSQMRADDVWRQPLALHETDTNNAPPPLPLAYSNGRIGEDGRYKLPAALLAQYPALAEMNWDDEGYSDVDGDYRDFVAKTDYLNAGRATISDPSPLVPPASTGT